MYKHKLRLESLTPEAALNLLKEGNARFVHQLERQRNHLEQINETKDQQHPFAVILSCIDSRTSAELIFDQGLGDILSIRIAGNIVNDDIIGSIEFGCKISSAKIVVVLGHTNCSAVRGACDGTSLGYFTGLLNKIHPSVTEELKLNKSKENGFVDNVALRNVVNSVNEIKAKSTIVKEMINAKQILLIGGLYDLNNGKVSFIEETLKQ